MGLIRQSAADFLKDAVVLDLGDLAAQGERIKSAAEAHARTVVQAAAKERERILAGAAGQGQREGFERGKAEGIEAGRKEGRAAAIEEFRARLEALEKSWTDALESFEEQRRTILIEAKRDILQLALEIAGRVTKRVVGGDPDAVTAQLESVLALITRHTRLFVRVNPEDAPLLRDTLPGLIERFPKAEHVELKEDASVSKGSCIARTAAGGLIDASIETQLDRIAEAVLPHRDRNAPGQPARSQGGAP